MLSGHSYEKEKGEEILETKILGKKNIDNSKMNETINVLNIVN